MSVLAYPTTVQEDLAELATLATEARRRRWQKDPVAWARERLDVTLWSKQVEILEAVRDHRRVAVQSCHEIGKSFTAGLVIAWWIDTNPPGDAFALTSAPTNPQVKAILWREIGRAHASGNLPGRVNQTEWHLEMPRGNEELVAIGRKPDEHNPTALQGIHAPRCLYVFDEACGMPFSLWESGDSLIANDASKAFAIGNPDDPTVHFAEICKPGSGWFVIQVGAFDSPAFTGERVPRKVLDQLIGRSYVEEKRRRWAPNWIWVDAEGHPLPALDGPVDRILWTPAYRRVVPPAGADPLDTNPFWQSKVLGLFPRNASTNTLIPMHWVKAAQERTLPRTGPSRLGVDVGGGGDASCGCHVDGPVARILWEDHNPDTMQTCGNVTSRMDDPLLNIERAQVDEIGIGRGVVDRAKELRYNVVGINVGAASDEGFTKKDQKAGKTKQFVNLRAEYWWNVRERFEKGEIDIDPNDEDLAGELVEIRFKRTSSGKIQIESKEEARRRGVPSPNRADALMLAYAEPKVVRRKAVAW